MEKHDKRTQQEGPEVVRMVSRKQVFTFQKKVLIMDTCLVTMVTPSQTSTPLTPGRYTSPQHPASTPSLSVHLFVWALLLWEWSLPESTSGEREGTGGGGKKSNKKEAEHTDSTYLSRTAVSTSSWGRSPRTCNTMTCCPSPLTTMVLRDSGETHARDVL